VHLLIRLPMEYPLNPAIIIASFILPSLIDELGKDASGVLGGQVEQILRRLTGVENLADMQQKLAASPELESSIRLELEKVVRQSKLASSAIASTSAHPEIPGLSEPGKVGDDKSSPETDESDDESDITYSLVQLDDTSDARAAFTELVQLNNPIQWTPPIVSYLVVIGFFGAIFMFLRGDARLPPGSAGPQIANLMLGALAAGFATVLNFWLGSSFGSRKKDAADATAKSIAQATDLGGARPPPLQPGATEPTPPTGPVPDSGKTTEKPAASTSSVVKVARIPASGIPDDIVKFAQDSQKKWRLPASVTLAQYGLESGWGRHMPAGSNNPFGMKVSESSNLPFVTSMTREEGRSGGTFSLPQRFRKFASIGEAFDAHAKLICTNPAYHAAQQVIADPNAVAKALTGVYATDHMYGTKLIAQMKLHDLYQFDLPPGLVTRVKQALS